MTTTCTTGVTTLTFTVERRCRRGFGWVRYLPLPVVWWLIYHCPRLFVWEVAKANRVLGRKKGK